MIADTHRIQLDLRTVPERAKRRLFVNGSELASLVESSHENAWLVLLAGRCALDLKLDCDIPIEMRTLQNLKNVWVATTKLIAIDAARAICSKTTAALQKIKPEWYALIAGETVLRFDVFQNFEFALNGTKIARTTERTQAQFFRWIGEQLGIVPTPPQPTAPGARVTLYGRIDDCEARYERLVYPVEDASANSRPALLHELHYDLQRLYADALTFCDRKTANRCLNLLNALMTYAALLGLHLPTFSDRRVLLSPEVCVDTVVASIDNLARLPEPDSLNCYGALALLRSSLVHARSPRFGLYRTNVCLDRSREQALLSFLLANRRHEGAFVAAGGAFGIRGGDTWQLDVCLNTLEDPLSHYHVTRTHQAYEVLCIVEALVDRMDWLIEAAVRTELTAERASLATDVGTPISATRKRSSALTLSTVIASVGEHRPARGESAYSGYNA
jgi:hypothetical protein